MIAAIEKMSGKVLDPTWLAGPIFDKELRVSSRRRRNYSLRFLYVLALMFFIAAVWLGTVDIQGNATVIQSRMAQAGTRIITRVVIFQFVAMQILAIIMLSNAISDEVYHRTLGLLMTTPVNSFQIVMGKVLSRMLQLILLLGITLPVLAIVRVFGGVSWGYLLSSLCITLTAAVFAGALSLLMSINNRRSYAVILQTLFLLATFYFIMPMVVAALWGRLNGHLFSIPVYGGMPPAVQTLRGSLLVLTLLHINPITGIAITTAQMLSPIAQTVPYSWLVQCIVLLVFSVLVLMWATAVVRKTALRQATGQLDGWFKSRRKKRKETVSAAVAAAGDNVRGAIKRVIGPPVVWRELRAPFIQGVDNRNNYIGLAVTIVALAITYLASARAKCLDEAFVHTAYIMLFGFIGTVVNMIFATTRITSEKESQSWLLLLATPLSNEEILFGKAVSAVRRCLPIWALMAGHVLLFVAIGYIHPSAIVLLLLLVTWVTVFVTGAGLYFSTRFTRTTSAAVAGFALIFGLWAIAPILTGLFVTIEPQSRLPYMSAWAHPAVQAEIIVASTTGPENADDSWKGIEYDRSRIAYHPDGKTIHFGRMMYIMAIVSASYVLAGLLFFWRAKLRVRRNVFT